MKLFDKTFFRFAGLFITILSLSLVIFIVLGYRSVGGGSAETVMSNENTYDK